MQYKNGDAAADIVGNAMMIEVNEVMVPAGDDNPIPVSGSFEVTGGATLAEQEVQTTHLAAIETAVESIDTKTPALGQAAEAASVPVVLPAAQIVTLTPPAAITGFATEAKQDTMITALGDIETAVDGLETLIDSSNTKLDSIITNTNKIVSPLNTGATLSNVSSSATNVTILASNAARHGATIHNDSTAILYVKFGATASTSSYTVKMIADAYYEVPFGYTGIIDGIWAAANGAARVTEITA